MVKVYLKLRAYLVKKLEVVARDRAFHDQCRFFDSDCLLTQLYTHFFYKRVYV
jgi:hypothetical protein